MEDIGILVLGTTGSVTAGCCQVSRAKGSLSVLHGPTYCGHYHGHCRGNTILTG